MYSIHEYTPIVKILIKENNLAVTDFESDVSLFDRDNVVTMSSCAKGFKPVKSIIKNKAKCKCPQRRDCFWKLNKSGCQLDETLLKGIGYSSKTPLMIGHSAKGRHCNNQA